MVFYFLNYFYFYLFFLGGVMFNDIIRIPIAKQSTRGNQGRPFHPSFCWRQNCVDV